MVLSTAAVYFFDSLVLENSSEASEPLVRIPHPGAYENLENILIAELMDSTIISFLYGKKSESNQYPAEQISYQLKSDNSYHLLAQRDLEQGFSEWYRYRGYYLSPLMEVLYQSTISPWLKATPSEANQTWHFIELPKNIWLMMLLLSTLALILSMLLLRKRKISKKEYFMQCVLVVFIGLPGLFFCWLFYERKGRFQVETRTNESPLA